MARENARHDNKWAFKIAALLKLSAFLLKRVRTQREREEERGNEKKITQREFRAQIDKKNDQITEFIAAHHTTDIQSFAPKQHHTPIKNRKPENLLRQCIHIK